MKQDKPLWCKNINLFFTIFGTKSLPKELLYFALPKEVKKGKFLEVHINRIQDGLLLGLISKRKKDFLFKI